MFEHYPEGRAFMARSLRGAQTNHSIPNAGTPAKVET